MLNNMVTRAFEFAADGFGVRMGKGVQLKVPSCMLPTWCCLSPEKRL